MKKLFPLFFLFLAAVFSADAQEFRTTLDNLCFQYKYDGRKLVTHKKPPGADWVYMVYDDRDRLVLMQDGGMRGSRQWLFTKYDALNRPVLTGIMTTDSVRTQEYMQRQVKSFYSKPFSRYYESRGNAAHGYTNVSFPSIVDPFQYWIVTYYDDYNWIADNYNGNRLRYSAGEYPNQPPASSKTMGLMTGTKTKVFDGGPTFLLSAVYYDEKSRLIQSVAENYKLGVDRITNVLDFTGKVVLSKNVHVEADITWRDKMTLAEVGRLLINNSPTPGWAYCGAVSSQVLAANTDGWIEAIVNEPSTAWKIGFTSSNKVEIDYAAGVNSSGSLFTYRGTTSSTNLAAAKPIVKGDVIRIERVGSTISFFRNGVGFGTPMKNVSTGPLIADVSIYANGLSIGGVRSSFSTTSHTISRRYEYDHAGRQKRLWHRLDSGPEIMLSENRYNELGQLIEKNLHSTAVASSAMQSIDYSYNIRSWLTGINGDADKSPEPSDLFGMDIFYNSTNTGLNSNDQQFNGNVSVVQWDNNAYRYSYDVMGRLTAADFFQKNKKWSVANGYSERTQFDFNGNIERMVRTDAVGGLMDDLFYDYGKGGLRSNKLLKVTDGGNKTEGFRDGANTDADYNYDANGNVITDKNKSITSNIGYLYPFNLPVLISRGGNTLNYIYDATGRKLLQHAVYYHARSQVDYCGEFQYEDDVLQFVHHEEGRIAVAGSEQIFYHDGTSAADLHCSNCTLSGSQASLKVTTGYAQPNPGLFVVQGIPVKAGENYIMRSKGFGVSVAPFLTARLTTASGAISDLTGLAARYPVSADAEAWVELPVTIPENTPANSTMAAGLFYTGTPLNTVFYVNEFEVLRIAPSDPEYQYHIKDHLGNVRVTFRTASDTDVAKASFESEQQGFLRSRHARRVRSALVDHTNNNIAGSTGYAQRLSGSQHEKIGLAKSIAVGRGDVVNAEVFAKYFDRNDPNPTPVLQALLSVLANPAASGAVSDGAGYTSNDPLAFPWRSGVGKQEDSRVPKAFINYIFINQRNDPASLRLIARPISIRALENGSDVDHERLFVTDTISEPGYVYIYLSNDGDSPTEVYFDDFTVEHIKSPIIQSQDYYPFGLTFNNFTRENSLPNKLQFGGKEVQDNLDLGLIDFGARMYMPEIGRWGVPDAHADKYFEYSPYSYAINNPVNVIDPDGNDIFLLIWFSKKDESGHAGIAVENYKTVTKKDSKGNVVLDSSGKPVTEQVKDGTYTYYDLWPARPVGDQEMKDDVTADYTKGKVITSLKELTDTDVTVGRSGRVSPEGRAADGVVSITTTYTQDLAAKMQADSDIAAAKSYNAVFNNCSTFAQRVLNAALGPTTIDASQMIRPDGMLRLIYKDASIVAPNNLYNAALQVKSSTPIKGPASVIAKPYLEYFGKSNRP